MATDVIYDLHVSEPTTKLGIGERVGWAWLYTDVRCDLHVRVTLVSNVGTGERVWWVWLLTLKCDLHVSDPTTKTLGLVKGWGGLGY